MGIPSFPGVLLFWKHSKSKAPSSEVILPSQDNFCSSESLGINKFCRKDSIASLFLFLLLYNASLFVQDIKWIRGNGIIDI